MALGNILETTVKFSTLWIASKLWDYISRLNSESPSLFVMHKVLHPTKIHRGKPSVFASQNNHHLIFSPSVWLIPREKSLREKDHVEVSLVDNKMHGYNTFNLCKWDMNSSSNYCWLQPGEMWCMIKNLKKRLFRRMTQRTQLWWWKRMKKLKLDVVVHV